MLKLELKRVTKALQMLGRRKQCETFSLETKNNHVGKESQDL
jgi:hypothetical protein